MKTFLLNILKFLFVFVSVVVIVSLINLKFTYPSNYFKLPKTTKYVIFGDSHGEFAMNSSLDGLVNLSQSGEVYLYTYHKVEKVLENNNVHTIFIDFCNSQIDNRQDTFLWSDAYLISRYPIFYQLLTINERKLIWKNNPKGLLNAHFKSLFVGLYRVITNKNVLNNNFIGGYKFLDHELNDSLIHKDLNEPNRKNVQLEMKISDLNLYNLDRILALCKSKNVKVYLIRCPLHPDWKYIHNEKDYKNLLKTRYSKVEFLDFKDFPISNNERADLEHLNYKGAKSFSSFFNNLLKYNLLEMPNKQALIDNEIMKREKDAL